MTIRNVDSSSIGFQSSNYQLGVETILSDETNFRFDASLKNKIVASGAWETFTRIMKSDASSKRYRLNAEQKSHTSSTKNWTEFANSFSKAIIFFWCIVLAMHC